MLWYILRNVNFIIRIVLFFFFFLFIYTFSKCAACFRVLTLLFTWPIYSVFVQFTKVWLIQFTFKIVQRRSEHWAYQIDKQKRETFMRRKGGISTNCYLFYFFSYSSLDRIKWMQLKARHGSIHLVFSFFFSPFRITNICAH